MGKAVSSNQKSAVRMNQPVRKRVHVVFGASSIFIHRRVSTSFLKFSRKFAINHRQSSNRFIALDKPIKKYIQEEHAEQKDSDKNSMGHEVSLLSEFLNRRTEEARKVLKKENMP